MTTGVISQLDFETTEYTIPVENDAVQLREEDRSLLPNWMPFKEANKWLQKYWSAYQRFRATGRGWNEERYKELITNMMRAWNVW